MFIHWDHASQSGLELSWPLVGGVFSLPYCQNVPVEEYHATAKTFNPQLYNPQEWAQQATRLRMQYVIFTTKHHNGYAMFHTSHEQFSVQSSPYGKDIVREFTDAMRAEGLRIGFYFSLSDWHHLDYPAFTEADKPYAFNQLRQPTPDQWERYLTFMFSQVRELLTNYGPVDILWFDGQWERTPEQWQVQELQAMIRQLQPNILLNDRLPGFGDFDTPEQFVPAQPPERAWETCMTMNESWGYNPSDTDFKSVRQLIHSLCEVASKGGNLLLNVSPMGDGCLQPEQVERLKVIEQWMASNAESIIGTEPGLESWQFYGPSTRKGNRVYLHLLMRPYETVVVRGVPIKKIIAVHVLHSGQKLTYKIRSSIIDSMFNPNPLGEVTIQIPESALDPYATVILLDFAA